MAIEKTLAEKIRKVLNLARGTTNPHEAAAAFARAQAMMQRHRITEAALHLEEGTEDPVDAEEIHDRHDPLGQQSQRVAWKGSVANALSKANGCKFYWHRTWNRGGYVVRQLRVVGRESDVETVRYLFTLCVREIERLARNESSRQRRQNGRADRAFMNAYRMGCARAVVEAIEEEERAIRALMRQEAGRNEKALVTLDAAQAALDRRRAETHRWVDDHLHLRPGRAPRITSSAGYHAGQIAGRGVYPGRSQRVTGGARRLGAGS